MMKTQFIKNTIVISVLFLVLLTTVVDAGFFSIFKSKGKTKQLISNTNSQVQTSLNNAPSQSYSSKYPIILIHGWNGNLNTLSELQNKLDQDGIAQNKGDIYSSSSTSSCNGGWPKAVSVNFEYYDEGKDRGIPYYATKLAYAIETLKQCTGSSKINIVAHSMGGLIARAYIANGGSDSANRLIMLETPNYGASNFMANIGQGLTTGEGSDVGLMIPNSSFIREMNNKDCKNRKQMVNIVSQENGDADKARIKENRKNDKCKDQGWFVRQSTIASVATSSLKGAANQIVYGCGHTNIHSPSQCGEAYSTVRSFL